MKTVSSMSPRSLQPSAFTLIELLLVVAIIVLLMVLALPAIRGIGGGINLTGGAEEMVGAFNLARQRAVAYNRQVALRFYEEPGSGGFKSYQLWEQTESSDPNSWKAVEPRRNLPLGVMVKKDPTHSAMLERFVNTAGKYAEAIYTPSGSLICEKDKAHVTLVATTGPTTGGPVSGLPPNFATIVVEPFNGRPILYRP